MKLARLLDAVRLRRRADELAERMDDPHCDPGRLRRTYAQFARVNALVAAWDATYQREVAPHLPSRASILDLGCGGGDVACRLAELAERQGREVEVTGIDPDPRAIAFARARGTPPQVHFRQALAADLLREGARFDVVVSNHVLHHLAPDALRDVLEVSAALARSRVVHADLRRSPWALPAFAAVSWPFRGSYVIGDGFRSIRRAFTPDELRALAPEGWRVHRRRPFRQLLTWPS